MRGAGSKKGLTTIPIIGRVDAGTPILGEENLEGYLEIDRLAKMARASGGNKPKLLDQVREAILMRYYSIRTEEAYVCWSKRSILFHGKRINPESGALCAGLSIPPCPRLESELVG